MIYTDMTKKAMKICFAAHKEQTDKNGLPYVYHPFHLAEQMKDENTTIVALLHDVIEDTEITLEDLEEQGFCSEVIDAISLMAHDKTVSYVNYIKKIKGNTLARTVKLADLKHNSNLRRLDKIDKKAVDRVEKYKNAMALLEGKAE